ncbi:MAG: hypothetical protein IKT38_06725 [Clostridia bacterium]|nr:hypothetical protein [Clostridia bacterium]
MTVGTNTIKQTAKSFLSGNFLKTVISSLVFLFCIWIGVYLSTIITAFCSVLLSKIFLFLFTLFLTIPLFFGFLRFSWRLIKESDDKPISVFYYFSHISLYFKVLKLIFIVTLKLLPVAVVLFLPVLFIWVLSQSFIFEMFDISIPLWSRNLTYAILFSRTISNFLLIFISLKYYIAPILFVADENIDVREALYMSYVVSKKTSLDFIFLSFSFIGWIIISLLAFPLPFTLPYFLTAYAVHTDFAITEYNEHIEKLNEKNYPTFSVGV